MNYIKSYPEKNELLERFIKYVKICTESSSAIAEQGIMPSSEGQKKFAQILAEELKDIDAENVLITPFCYIYASFSASKGMEHVPPFCLSAHMDTSEEVSGKNVNPIVHTAYDGTPIDLKCAITLNPKNDKFLAQAALEKDTVITSDGTTLLGADDKAGIAEIITALKYLNCCKELKHGKIEVIFSPDEETGHGMDKVPLELICSKFAYTVDGGHIGSLEKECFNAYCSKIIFNGKAAHTGNARESGMVNAVQAASNFVNSLPITERPETTDGLQGFYAPIEISGSIESAFVYVLLRDFTEKGIKKRIKTVKNLAEAIAAASGCSVQIETKEQYKNMKTALDNIPFVVEKLEKAYSAAGIKPQIIPIRGGTDGARLTSMGIPAPNIFTGGHNYHSRSEWASLSQMAAAVDVIINLAVIIADDSGVVNA